jgi:tRNA pseudouridine38-40 synthase
VKDCAWKSTLSRSCRNVPRFKLVVEYAGTRYSGWQIQKNARTVQGEIDSAIRKVSGRREFELYGSGRTDAGVHALAQVAHLELYTNLPPETLRRRINDELPADIHIITLDKAPHRFHARHDAVLRSYLYQISRRRTAFAKPFVWWVREPLDLTAMRAAAAGFVGRQDFAAYSDDDPEEKSTVVAVDRVEIVEAGALLLVRVQGSHFLWKMVRRMVGVLVAVGKGEKIGDETPASLTAPAAGLFLERVYYPGEPVDERISPVIAIGPG